MSQGHAPEPAADPAPEVFASAFVIAQHLARHADAALEPDGLTSRQWLLLAVVARGLDHPPTLTEAARVFGTSRQNVRQLATQLVARGFLRLEPDPADARATRLVPAEAAAVLDSPASVARQQAALASVLACFDREELTLLAGLTSRWALHLQGLGEAR